MTIDGPLLRATPFHTRASAASRGNAWQTRNGVTLAEYYESVEAEALGARLNVALADISWRRRVLFKGPQAERLLSRLLTRPPAALAPGAAFKALWLSDAGGVRGVGVLARFGKETFQLVSSAPDAEWISAAAKLFNVPVRDVSEEAGGLAVVGPYARATLSAAGLEADIAPLAFRKLSWRGIEVTVSRWGEHGGYEIWCEPDDGILVWDRLMRAGERFGIVYAGVAAMDLLDMEAGVARPDLDYAPARDGDAASPTPASLGLESLIDSDHTDFNGRNAALASVAARKLVGIEIDSRDPAPFTPLMRNGTAVGHTLRSFYSPALQCAIALAFVDAPSALPGTAMSLTLPPSFVSPELRVVSARVMRLPFLDAPRLMEP